MPEISRRRPQTLASGQPEAKDTSSGQNGRRIRRVRRRKPKAGISDGNMVLFLTSLSCLLIACSLWVGTKLYDLWGYNTPSMDADTDKDHESLPWNDLYRVPGSHEFVGDRSTEYVLLRKEIDKELPPDEHRSSQRVKELTIEYPDSVSMEVHHSDAISYDVHDCPDTPPDGYPFAWKTVDILKHWPIDNTTIPDEIHQGICIFDFKKDYNKAEAYRKAEVPFVVAGDPAVSQTIERWNSPHYLDRLLGDVQHRCEVSKSNHFMYYVPPRHLRKRKGGAGKEIPADWSPPTEDTRMTYAEWLSHANVPESELTPHSPHWYFRLIGCGYMGAGGSCDKGSSEWLFDELPFFQPKPNLYIVDPEEQKGIHCRMGMSGVIAENHFDASRNAIAVLQGQRRYILSHPDQCKNLALYPKGHPSARHSAVSWGEPELDKFPEFLNANSNEVVLQAGHVLYLPTMWFHFIVSLGTNIQCNTRSGINTEYRPAIKDCGF